MIIATTCIHLLIIPFQLVPVFDVHVGVSRDLRSNGAFDGLHDCGKSVCFRYERP